MRGSERRSFDPISTHSLGGLAHAYLLMRQYDESIPHFQKALDLYPNAAFIRAQLAWSYAMKRMYPEALAEYDKIAEPDKAVAPENQLVADGLGWVYAVAGRRADALKIAKEMEDLSSLSLCRFLSARNDLRGSRSERRGVWIACWKKVTNSVLRGCAIS